MIIAHCKEYIPNDLWEIFLEKTRSTDLYTKSANTQ